MSYYGNLIVLQYISWNRHILWANQDNSVPWYPHQRRDNRACLTEWTSEQLIYSINTSCYPQCRWRGVKVLQTLWEEVTFSYKVKKKSWAIDSAILSCLGKTRTLTNGTRIRCATITPQGSINFWDFHFSEVALERLELSQTEPESGVLPLHHKAI